MDYRIEHDTMGEVRVPADALWRAQTQRAVENFPISGQRLERAQIAALALIKGAAAARERANSACIDRRRADAIVAAAAEVGAGEHDAAVPDRRLPDRLGHLVEHERQRGARHAWPASGSAPRAPQRPRQRFAVVQRRVPVGDPRRRDREPSCNDLLPALDHLPPHWTPRATEFDGVVKSGRTHLMDATPVTLGQEFGGYAAQVRYGIERLRLGAAPGGRAAARRHRGRHRHQQPAGLRRSGDRGAWRAETGLPFTEARDHFEAQGARDALVEASASCGRSRSGCTRSPTTSAGWAPDPRTGLGEMLLPDLQPGSSIMPGKVNPVVCEAVLPGRAPR